VPIRKTNKKSTVSKLNLKFIYPTDRKSPYSKFNVKRSSNSKISMNGKSLLELQHENIVSIKNLQLKTRLDKDEDLRNYSLERERRYPDVRRYNKDLSPLGVSLQNSTDAIARIKNIKINKHFLDRVDYMS
jgi:hypothetical protein